MIYGEWRWTTGRVLPSDWKALGANLDHELNLNSNETIHITLSISNAVAALVTAVVSRDTAGRRRRNTVLLKLKGYEGRDSVLRRGIQMASRMLWGVKPTARPERNIKRDRGWSKTISDFGSGALTNTSRALG
ncbi:hypothetical protein EVAR_55260_1 [Eumeta japonica]|uniref:Uncharacterized protein n=1 Tax=Eumeta variegata TaxID=151549 RepID=A0A4C1Z6V2_EUMVA|nr:hypothetical protein EVAR_55260_1 [Eumeta japonica]